MDAMDSSRTPLVCPDHFAFPFEPYPIQVDFMRNIFMAIEEGKIGLFESPTGTGKSLSIICGSLTWLKTYKENMELSLRKIREKEKALDKSRGDSADWLTADYEIFKEKEALKGERVKIEADLRREIQWKKRREKMAEKRRGMNQDKPSELTENILSIEKAVKESKEGVSKEGVSKGGVSGEDLSDSHLLPEEYNSDAEDTPTFHETSDEVDHVRKIYYCTRTHSQITQFIKELKRSPFGSSTRVSALASRQNLCVFEPVRQLKSQRQMNDRCIELQKNKTKPFSSFSFSDGQKKKRQKRDLSSLSSCPYFHKENIETLSTKILNDVLDIEDSVKAGVASIGCPYYASRLALPDAEVVAVPYNLILHRNTRNASGINLKNQIIIIDESHNFFETISNIYKIEISQKEIQKTNFQLKTYFLRFKKRFTPKNLLNIKQLIFVLKQLEDVWKCLPECLSVSETSHVITIDKFLNIAKLQSVNLFKIIAYCKKSLIARKLMGFSEMYPEDPTGHALSNQPDETQSASPLMIIESFLETLTNENKDGRIVFSTDAVNGGKLKFLLLNPAVYVSDIFQTARCVILAGGTMKPISDFENQLIKMAGVPAHRVHKFSCGHVVPPENILPIALKNSPSGIKFEFNYENRSSPEMIIQLGCLISNICNIVPGGIVCFLPSYDYETLIFATLKNSGDFLKNIERKKTIFREPKQSADVEAVLKTYAHAITHPVGSQTGAIMFAVVGGKLSEGINFSDHLGRCVVMVGLPFPNLFSVELKEKMNFLDTKLPKSPDGRLPSKLHYEGLCMKAVNQSIGRAIRHRGDYAVILLVDARYAFSNINGALPEWIGDRLKISPKFSEAFSAIRQFFAEKSKQEPLL